VGLQVLKRWEIECCHLVGVDKDAGGHLVGFVVDGTLLGRATTERVACERGRGDGNDQHRHTHCDQQHVGHGCRPVPVSVVVAKDLKRDGGHDKEDARRDGRDDGHHHGGHHQTLVPASCSANGESSRDKEEDRGPDSSGKGEVAGHHASDVRAKSDEAADDVDNAKRCRCLDVVRIFDVDLLLGRLDDVDHLVGGVWCICLALLLIHFEVSLFVNAL